MMGIQLGVEVEGEISGSVQKKNNAFYKKDI